jgi:hypothetical protein
MSSPTDAVASAGPSSPKARRPLSGLVPTQLYQPITSPLDLPASRTTSTDRASPNSFNVAFLSRALEMLEDQRLSAEVLREQ